MFGAKIKIDKALYERVKAVADKAGYSSVEEFVVNMIEKELAKLEEAATDEQLEERLRGLGYIE
jgi:metal-responsive CopG/Arc/MetJ family transcriptional regulator